MGKARGRPRQKPFTPRLPTTVELAKEADRAMKKATDIRQRSDEFVSTELANTAERQEMSALLKESLLWYGLPCVKSDEECAERLDQFFQKVVSAGITPTYEKLCLALGTYREVVERWERGDLGQTRSGMIKKAKQILADMDATLVSQGKIPQVTYIFRSKNYYGMQDKTEMVVTPNNHLDGQTKEELEAKYLEGAVTD